MKTEIPNKSSAPTLYQFSLFRYELCTTQQAKKRFNIMNDYNTNRFLLSVGMTAFFVWFVF